MIQAEFLKIHLCVGINQEESQMEAASAITEAIAAPLIPISGIPKLTENQNIVQQHIHQCHDHRIHRQHFSTCNANIQRTEHHVDKSEEKPKIRQLRNSMVASKMESDEMSRRTTDGANR